MLNEADLIKGCSNNNKAAQKAIYETYSCKMRAVCLRYVSQIDEAEDVLQEGFITIFSEIKKFSGKGSFEGWIRKIMVHKAINYYKKNKNFYNNRRNLEEIEKERYVEQSEEADIDINCKNEFDIVKNANFTQEELFEALGSIDDSFRIVFNLFYLENYSHKEISEALSIEEKTSRTRLFRAKKLLQNHLYHLSLEKIKIGISL